MFLMACVWDEQLLQDDWFIDSDCSNKKECFPDLYEHLEDSVKLGNKAMLGWKANGMLDCRLTIKFVLEIPRYRYFNGMIINESS